MSGISQREQVAYIFGILQLNRQVMLLQKRSTFRFQSVLEPFSSQDTCFWQGKGALK